MASPSPASSAPEGGRRAAARRGPSDRKVSARPPPPVPSSASSRAPPSNRSAASSIQPRSLIAASPERGRRRGARQKAQATVAEQAHGGVGATDHGARLGDGQAGDDPKRHHLGLVEPQ